MRPPYDPELEHALRSRADEVVTTLRAEDIPGLRERSAGREVVEHAAVGHEVSVHAAPVPGAPDVDVVLVRPTASPGTPAPVVLHLHGGGLVTGSPWDDVVPLLELLQGTGCAVASVGYRLAPEHPYPAAVDDAHAALRWVTENAGGLGLDASRVVVEGISAGGRLAAALALRARDRGGPAIAGQMLLCPMLDDRNDSGSARQMAGHGSWDRSANATAWRAYLGPAAGGADVPAYAAAARATHLTGLPPAFLDVGSAETFRDEVVRYASRLWLDGGAAELHVWPGAFHGFDYFEPTARVSRDARAARRRWLERLRSPAAVGPPVAPAREEAQP